MRKNSGRCGLARPGRALLGAARLGKVRQDRPGKVRRGPAWRGKALQGSAGTVINVSCMRDKKTNRLYPVKGDRYGIREKR